MRGLWVLLVAAGCGAATTDARLCPTPSAVAASPARLPTIVLVTIDGVRAGDVLDHPERLPALHALMARGVGLGGAAAPMVASGPRFVSLPGYRELLTGRRGDGCVDNHCPPIAEPTLFDELHAAGIDDLVTIASWEVIGRAVSIAPASLALSVGRHGGATRARLAVSDATARDLDAAAASPAWPGHGDYRPDALTARLALDLLDVRRPRALWVALGDTDEYAHRGDYNGYLRALAAADAFVGRLIARVGLDDAVVLVTSDHGRSANFRDHGNSPESSATWLVAAGATIPRVGRARSAVAAHLADVAPTLRALLHLPADGSPRAGAPIPALLDGSRVAARWAGL